MVKKFLVDEALNMSSSFGEWLKPQRKRCGLTQKALVIAANNVCTEQYISNLENKYDVGKGGQPIRPRLEIVDALAKALADKCGEDYGRLAAEARAAAGYAPPDMQSGNAQAQADELDPAALAEFSSRVQKLTAQQKRDFKVAWQMAKDYLGRLEREKQ